MENWQKKLEEKVKKYMDGYSPCHDFYHAKRVAKYAEEIAKKIKCDKDILIAAALIHDTGYKGNEKDTSKHQFRSMELAKEWLPESGFPPDKIEAVLEVIRLHDNFCWSESYEPTDNVEVKVVQDADRIDAIGAIGIARLGYFYGYANFPLYSKKEIKKDEDDRPNHSFFDQLKRESSQKWKNMNFSYSKRISKKKQGIIEKYYEELKQELKEAE